MKKSQIETESDKKPKTFYFSNFFMQFVTFSTDFVVQNVAKRKQGTVLVQNVSPKNLMQFSR